MYPMRKTPDRLLVLSSFLLIIILHCGMMHFSVRGVDAGAWNFYNRQVQIVLLVGISTVFSVLYLFNTYYVSVAAVLVSTAVLAFVSLSVEVDRSVYLLLLLAICVGSAVFFDPPWGTIYSMVLVAVSMFGFGPLGLDFRSLPESIAVDLYRRFLLEHVCFVLLIAAIAALRFLLRELDSQKRELVRINTALDKLSDTNLAYQNYTAMLEEKTMESERQRISREIHDIVGYSLTNVLMMVQAAEQLMDDSPVQAKDILGRAHEHIAQSIQESRMSVRRLRSQDTFQITGANLFLHLCNTFSEISGIDMHVDFGNLQSSLDKQVEKAIYRLLQEGMTNSFRHGKASRVDITFSCEGGHIIVRMQDNGIAAEGMPIHEGIGIKGMRERIEAIGGTVQAGPMVGGGFYILARIPEGGDDE